MNREDELQEFKKTTGELNDAMISVSAILNKHKHGTLYFGLKNDRTPFPFTITDSTLRDVSRKIFEAIKPQIIPTISTKIENGTEIIVVEFSGEDVPYSAFGKYYIRTADEDREMSPSELRKMMISREYTENWENRSSKSTVADVDDRTLMRFFDSAVKCGRLPDISYDKVELLQKLGVLNDNVLTNAGEYLFSKNKPITLKMAVFATDHKTTFLDISREEGNIFQLIDAALEYIVKNIRWRVESGEDGLRRKEIPEIPVDALREAIVNSFAHARYDLPVQHEIDIYSNRISITNPGSFANEYKPTDFYKRDIHSFLRNEVIARILYLCKNVETFGSGLKKIYTLCDEQGVSVSYINEDDDFTLEFSRVDRNIMPSNGIINGIDYGEISDNELAVLSVLREKPGATISAIAGITKKSVRTVARTIDLLKSKGLIERVGSNRKGYWKVIG